MAINDPSYFLTSFKGDFNGASTDNSGYGALPAAEQNQTYVAYFNGMAGTGPELIDQTALFIKYLIDKDGNITKPESDSTSLLNLYSNFESGKTVTVLPQTATQTSANLIGDHIITDMGTIQPLVITETGSGRNNFITTMSFAEYRSIITEGLPSFNFLAKRTGNQTINSGDVVEWNAEISDEGNNFASNIYTIDFDPTNYGLNLSFQIGLAARVRVMNVAIQVSTDGGSTWSNLPIEEFIPSTAANVNVNTGVIYNSGDGQGDIYYFIATPDQYTMDGSTYVSFETTYHYLRTRSYTFNTSDKIRVYIPTVSTTTGIASVIYGTPSTTETFFTVTSNYTPILQTTSSYWSGATYPTDETLQWLTASKGLSSFLNNDYVQLTPNSALSMSFSNIILPANLEPGDYIRFEYDPNKQAKIYNIGNLSDGRTTIQIHPAIPTGSQLNHFVIYRIVKDGNYLIVNEPRVSGANLTGFLQPKYITQELKDNFSDIVNKLEADGLLT
jgi:hypothetical protein